MRGRMGTPGGLLAEEAEVAVLPNILEQLKMSCTHRLSNTLSRAPRVPQDSRHWSGAEGPH